MLIFPKEWFGTCIIKFATSLPVKSTSTGIMASGEVPPVSDASVQTLTSLAKDFEELAHTCLLVLHLEVRKENKLEVLIDYFGTSYGGEKKNIS